MNRHFGAISPLFAIIGVVSVAGLNPAMAQTKKPAKKSMEKPGMIVTIKTDKPTYKPTDPIKLSMTVKNNAKSAATLDYSSGQNYDFFVWVGKPNTGQSVWSWAMDKRFIAMLQSKKLEAGKTLTYAETFTPASPLKPGTYTAVGIVTIRGEKRPSGTTTFTVAGSTGRNGENTPKPSGLSKITLEEALASVPKTEPKYEDYAKRLTEAEAALKEKPDDPATKKTYVETAYEYGHEVMAGANQIPAPIKYRAALALFRRALKVDPDHAPSQTDKKSIEDVYTQLGRPIPE